MSYEFTIERVSAIRMRIHSDEECIHDELNEFFKFPDPSYDPDSYRHRKWDGMKRLYTKKSGLIDIGLLEWVLKFAVMNKYKYTIDPRLNYLRKETPDSMVEYVDGLKLSRWDENNEAVELIPYQYQYNGVYCAIKKRRKILLAATGAGKSLMQYIIARYYLDEAVLNETEAKILMVVPSQMLCTQMRDNFIEYSQYNGFNTDAHLHLIYNGATKMTNKPIVIATWQGIQNEDADWFKQFTHLCVDEVHGAKAEKVTHICKSCINAEDRIGLTGTLNNKELHQLQCTAHFGSPETIVTTKQLQELGQAADTMITMINCNYQMDDRKFVKNLDYVGEIETIMSHPYRNKMILSFARTLKGNTLLIFDRVAHIEYIAEELKKLKKNVYTINGKVDQAERDHIKKLTESGDDVTILASYGTMSTGVSIKKLHNLVFCHPSKSIIRVLQTVGRLLRMHSTKDRANIFDLVDVFKCSAKDDPNTAMKHAKERYGFYVEHEHKTCFKTYEMNALLPKDDREEIKERSDKRKRAAKARKERNKFN